MSHEFWLFYQNFVLGFVVVGVVIGALAGMKSAPGLASGTESAYLWVKPVVVGAAWAGIAGDAFRELPAIGVFTGTFIVGLVCGLTTMTPLLQVRDFVLGVLSGIAVVVLIILRLTAGSEIAVVYILYALATGVGLLLGGRWKSGVPVRMVAIVGGLELVDFLLSPFGPAAFPSISISMVTTGLLGAVTFGLLIRLRPEFVIHLAGLSIGVLGVVLQVFLAFEAANTREALIEPDWSVFWGVAGVLIGYGLTRAGFLAVRPPRRIR
ncbi:hypothetical protein [Plantibacter flavus]|uniref:hypothetical protein n=1 Tax=Plantibacter flavus TaxID=150123 RepID=UPI0010C1D12F|nr:hypothetical protein [Plantibacter flavus]